MSKKIKNKLKAYLLVLTIIYLIGLFVSMDFNWIDITNWAGRFLTVFVAMFVFILTFQPEDFK